MRAVTANEGMTVVRGCGTPSGRTVHSGRAGPRTKRMAPTRTGVHIQGGDFMAVWQGGKDIKELAYLEKNSKDMLDELHWWASALMAARSPAR